MNLIQAIQNDEILASLRPSLENVDNSLVVILDELAFWRRDKYDNSKEAKKQ